MITGYRCIGCGTQLGVNTPWPWRCPRADEGRVAHVLRLESDGASSPPADDDNPFLAYRARMAWYAFALARGMSDADAVSLVRDVDAAIAAVDGRGFVETPFGRADALSDALRFAPEGGIWVKDETIDVAGSHKARHLMGVLLHLLVAERAGLAPSTRPRLAVASCGNAALAAATLAAAVAWPIDVYVPPHAELIVLDRLRALGAHVTVCPRRTSDPPGDPCLYRFREAVTGGAVPFSVQGPENGLCIDGGRTLGWEMIRQLDGERLERVFVQVGGGALATAIGDALVAGPSSADAVRRPPRLHAVQAEGCAPLAAAWRRIATLGVAPTSLTELAARASDCMHPWAAPASLASGILDDETYDWLGVVRAMAVTDGGPVVAPEYEVKAAHTLATTTTGIRVDHTGTAGLAGVCAVRAQLMDAERVAVLFTGTFRDDTTALGAI